MLAACIVSATAFAPQPVLLPSSPVVSRGPEPVMLSGRRAAILTGAAALSATTMPVFADSVADIAARNAAAAEAEREAKANAKPVDTEAEKSGAINTVGAVLVGSVALSVPFYYKNIARLFTKITSGGDDDGYSTYKD